MKKNDQIATVLAFEKKLVPSDGFFYSTNWNDRHSDVSPLSLIEKSVRGTISNRLPKALREDPAKLGAEIQKPNLQRVDCCALTVNHDTLKMTFTLKVLSNVEKPSACNNVIFNESYTQVVKEYIAREGFNELAMRYAHNIANARFFWRNRVGAENIEVAVKVINKGNEASWTFDAFNYPLSSFDSTDENLVSLAQRIADALCGKIPFLLLEINAYAQVGKAQEVYPSEELVLDKSNNKNKKSKVLYHVNGIAAMHSQKIGNALRSIDTWYPGSEDADAVAEIGPIAIEPYGAVTNRGIAFRNSKNKSDFFTLFDKFARGISLDNIDQEHYVMAVLIRGGVFGESGKDA